MLRARIFCLIENSSKKSLLNEASSLHIKINRVKKIKVQLLINIFSSQKKGGADKLTRHSVRAVCAAAATSLVRKKQYLLRTFMPAFYVTCPQNKKMSRSIQAHFSLLQIHICVIWQECTVLLHLTKHAAAAAAACRNDLDY